MSRGVCPSDHDNSVQRAEECLRCSTDFLKKIEAAERERDSLQRERETWQKAYHELTQENERLKTERDEALAACVERKEALNAAYALIRGECCADDCYDCLTNQTSRLCAYRTTLTAVIDARSSHAGSDMLRRIREQDTALAAFRKCLQGLVDAIRELEGDLPDSALCLGQYGDHMKVALPLLATDAGKATLEYIERLEAKAERLTVAEELLRDLYPGNFGDAEGCTCRETGKYDEHCVFGDVCKAIDAYLKEVEKGDV